jgi:hypothetical protein
MLACVRWSGAANVDWCVVAPPVEAVPERDPDAVVEVVPPIVVDDNPVGTVLFQKRGVDMLETVAG